MVTRSDGRLALGRLGALCEQVFTLHAQVQSFDSDRTFFFFFFLILRLQSGMQIKELNSQEYEVILVSSGAVGIGRQRLRYRKLVNSRLFCAG